MSDGLHRLVYYSRNSLSGSEQAIGREIQQVLASSRRNNAADGITGALLFNRGCFAQQGKRVKDNDPSSASSCHAAA